MYASVANRTIGVAAQNITRDENSAGESALGNLVADGERDAMKTNVGFDTLSDIRANLSVGNITWKSLYDVQPTGDTVLSMNLSGEQILNALEEQW